MIAIKCLLPLALLLAAGLGHAQPNPYPQPRPQPNPQPTAVVPVAPVPAVPAMPAMPAEPAAPPAPAEPGRIYTPGTFDRLELAGAARVLLVQGDRDQVFVAGDADVQKGVEVELSGRQLVIRPAGGWKFWHTSKLFVQVEMRQLKALSLSGASDVHAPGPLKVDQLRLNISGAGLARLDQLDARQLNFVISGAGDGQLGGRVDEMALQISGKGKVVADRLQAQRARVSVSGIGNVVLWVTDELTANISGVGSVDYFGSPNVQRSVSGMGSISAKGDKKP